MMIVEGCFSRLKEVKMTNPYPQRIARCGEHMRHLGIDVPLLTKPSNMFYLTGDGYETLKAYPRLVMSAEHFASRRLFC